MNDIREIVTRSVVAKGKKIITLHESLLPQTTISTILGCFIVNHIFDAELTGDRAKVNGQFELDIWYTYEDNNGTVATEVVRKIICYEKRIRTKPVVENYSHKGLEIIVTVTGMPECTKVDIQNDAINVDITLELLAEVIGETKIKVAIIEQNECFNYQNENFEDFEDEIDENFIQDTQQ